MSRFDGILGSAKLASVMVIVIYITHIVACIWYTIGNNDQMRPDGQLVQGWVSQQNYGKHPVTGEEVGVSTKWLRAFYWAMIANGGAGIRCIRWHSDLSWYARVRGSQEDDTHRPRPARR